MARVYLHSSLNNLMSRQAEEATTKYEIPVHPRSQGFPPSRYHRTATSHPTEKILFAPFKIKVVKNQ